MTEAHQPPAARSTEGARNRAATGHAPRGPFRVVVVDDHAMFRTGVKAEIGRTVAVVGEAADAERAIAVVLQTRPDVVLLDVHLPGGGGVEVLRRVHERNPEQKFLALSVSDAAEDVIGVIRAGARGYVTKSINGSELVEAIRRVAEGDAVFSHASPASCWMRSQVPSTSPPSMRISIGSPSASAQRPP